MLDMRSIHPVVPGKFEPDGVARVKRRSATGDVSYRLDLGVDANPIAYEFYLSFPCAGP